MQSIGVCIVVQKNHTLKQTKECLFNLYEQSKGAVINFYILNNGNEEPEMRSFLEKISQVMSYETQNPVKTSNYTHFFKEIPYFQALNELIKKTTEDFVCLFKNGVFVNKNWYANMLHSFKLIQNTGAVSIRSSLDNTVITLISNSDFELVEAHQPRRPFQMNGILFCPRNTLFTVGGFCDKLFKTGYEIEEFLRRLGSNGFESYYAKDENCIDLGIVENKRTPEGEFIMNEVIKEMKINGVFKTSL